MHSIPQNSQFTAEWRQPRLMDRFYELRSGSFLFGSLDFQSPFSSFAYAETTDGKWIFNRTGFWQRKVTISNEDDSEEIAIYHPRFWGGKAEIQFTNGYTYFWKSINFWATQWAVINSNDEVLFVIHRGVENQRFSDIFKTQMTVDIYPSKGVEGTPTVLLSFAFYLLILQQKDADTGP